MEKAGYCQWRFEKGESFEIPIAIYFNDGAITYLQSIGIQNRLNQLILYILSPSIRRCECKTWPFIPDTFSRGTYMFTAVGECESYPNPNP